MLPEVWPIRDKYRNQTGMFSDIIRSQTLIEICSSELSVDAVQLLYQTATVILHLILT